MRTYYKSSTLKKGSHKSKAKAKAFVLGGLFAKYAQWFEV
jgi:hypothetical protein